VLAYDYPLLGVFWTLVLASCFFLVIFVIIWALIDNFRRKDHSGLAKALWLIFISLPASHRGVRLSHRSARCPDAFDGPAQVR
jgi:hypothetical protein